MATLTTQIRYMHEDSQTHHSKRELTSEELINKIAGLERYNAELIEALKTIDKEICYGYCGNNDCYNRPDEYKQQNCRLKNIIQSVIHKGLDV